METGRIFKIEAGFLEEIRLFVGMGWLAKSEMGTKSARPWVQVKSTLVENSVISLL